MDTVIDPGKGHRYFGHRWKLVEAKDEQWDAQKYGEKVELIDDLYAIYRWLYRCKCGAVKLEENVALI